MRAYIFRIVERFDQRAKKRAARPTKPKAPKKRTLNIPAAAYSGWPLSRLATPLRKMVGLHIMTPRDIHHANTGLQALGHNPRLQIIRPAPILPPRLHHLATTDKSVPSIRTLLQIQPSF